MNVWTTKLRGPALGLTLAAALVLSIPAQAADKKKSSKPEGVGVLSGLVIGAAAGGPIGAIVGAAGGGILGDRWHRKDVKNAALSADLEKNLAKRAELESLLAQTEAHGKELGQSLAKTRDLEAAVGFRTNDASLSDDDVARLQKIGSLVGSLGQMKVRVSGYADPRGSEQFNASLSQRRADSVAGVLSAAGVPSDRIVIEAKGEHESSSSEGDLEGYAFERRVTVRIEQEGQDGNGQAVASLK
jgi:outer membrane protein OmpA-like peptidoglycan-associated protein